MPTAKVAGTRGPMAELFNEVIAKGWTAEPHNGSKVKVTGPNGEGPIFMSMRTIGRGLQNERANLRRVGFPFDETIEKENEEVATPLRAVEPEPDLTELPAPVEQMLEALRHTLGNEFAAARHDADSKQWEQMYTEEVEKNRRLEEANAGLQKRCEEIENRWKTLKALFKD